MPGKISVSPGLSKNVSQKKNAKKHPRSLTLPFKNDGWKTTFLLRWWNFRSGYVKRPGCKPSSILFEVDEILEESVIILISRHMKFTFYQKSRNLVSKHWSFWFLLSHYIPHAFDDIPQAQAISLPEAEISKCQWRKWHFDRWSRILPWAQYQKVVVIKRLHETWPSAYRNAKASYLPASLVHETWRCSFSLGKFWRNMVVRNAPSWVYIYIYKSI